MLEHTEKFYFQLTKCQVNRSAHLNTEFDNILGGHACGTYGIVINTSSDGMMIGVGKLK